MQATVQPAVWCNWGPGGLQLTSTGCIGDLSTYQCDCFLIVRYTFFIAWCQHCPVEVLRHPFGRCSVVPEASRIL